MEDETRRAAAPHNLDVLPEHPVAVAGSEGLHRRLLGREAAGEARSGTVSGQAVGNLPFGKHPLQEPVAVAFDGPLDPGNVGGVEADANDTHNLSMPEPLESDSFELIAHPHGRALVCRPLALVAPHVFTTRVPSTPGPPAASADGWAQVAGILGVAEARIVRLTQVHGARVVRVPDEAPGPRATGTWADADAAVTADPGLALAVKVADCVPILLADPRTGAVAAVHAGWRGTAELAAAAAVAALGDRYASAPRDLVAALGPSIGPCCYQVGTEVADRFIETGVGPGEIAEWFSVEPRPARRVGLGLGSAAGAAAAAGKLWLDTWRANADQLAAAGVQRANIHVAGICTACHADVLHSYRVDGARAGRLLAAIRSAGARSGPAR